jgi:hypothetical protein
MPDDLFQIDCLCCKRPVAFSISDLDTSDLDAPYQYTSCPECGKKYGLQGETLKRQLKMFAALCRQIQQSEEILGNTAVAVDVGPHNVKIPFKLLLTRLKSTLDLQVGDTKLVVTYRVQPIQKK